MLPDLDWNALCHVSCSALLGSALSARAAGTEGERGLRPCLRSTHAGEVAPARVESVDRKGAKFFGSVTANAPALNAKNAFTSLGGTEVLEVVATAPPVGSKLRLTLR